MKGNLFSSRNLILQALRSNENTPAFYLEYLKFELRFLEKVMERRSILSGGPGAKQEFDFIDEEDEQPDVEGEIKHGEEANLVKIVAQNIMGKFGDKEICLLRDCYKALKESKYVDQQTTDTMKVAY